jgi:hypothetical protein
MKRIPVITSHRASLERERTLQSMGYTTKRVRLSSGDEIVLKSRPGDRRPEKVPFINTPAGLAVFGVATYVILKTVLGQVKTN